MTTIYSVYDQLADLMARLDSKSILSLKANADVQGRFDHLVQKSKETSIDGDEKDELDHFVVLERLIRLAKIRATNG